MWLASPNLYWGDGDSNTKEWNISEEPSLGHWLLSPLLFSLLPVSNFKKDEEVGSQENVIPGLSILARYKVISHLENVVIMSSELPKLIVFIPLLCSSGQHCLGSTVIRILRLLPRIQWPIFRIKKISSSVFLPVSVRCLLLLVFFCLHSWIIASISKLSHLLCVVQKVISCTSPIQWEIIINFFLMCIYRSYLVRWVIGLLSFDSGT